MSYFHSDHPYIYIYTYNNLKVKLVLLMRYEKFKFEMDKKCFKYGTDMILKLYNLIMHRD